MPTIRCRYLPGTHSRPSVNPKLIYIATAIALAMAGTSKAQDATSMGLDPFRRLSQAVFESWGEEEGFPQSTVRSILQTPDGYMWIGSQGGLVRFNGVDFVTHDRSNTPAFLGPHGIRSMLHAQGTLWVGSSGSGLLRVSGVELDRVNLGEDLDYATISALAEHPDGSIWGATFGEGVFVIPPSGGEPLRLTTDQGLPDDYATALHIEKNGVVWIGTKAGLTRFMAGEWTTWDVDDGLPASEVTSVWTTGAGVLSVGTTAGLRLFDGMMFSPGVAAQDVEVAVQFEDRYGTRWLGTDGSGVVRLTWGSVDTFSSDHGLTDNSVTAIYEDMEGSVWIGTDGGGLNRLRPAKFESFSQTEGLASDMAYGVWVDPEGRIWVGSDDAGISIIGERSTTHLTVKDGLSSNSVMSIMGTPDGVVWAGTYGGGLNRIGPDGITHLGSADGLAHDVVSSLVAAPDGRLIIGTDGGVSVLEDGEFSNVTVKEGLPSPIVMSVLLARDGTIWAGTYDGGIASIKDETVRVFNRQDGLAGDMVLAMYQSGDGALWVGTYGGGITRIVDGFLESLTTHDGLHDDVIYSIVEDDDENLWMTSNNGLFSVPRAQLEEVAAGTRDRLTTTAYGRDDGLKSQEFNGGFQPAAWRATDGRLVFPSIRGIAVISPQSVPTNTVIPRVHIEALLVDGKPVELGGSVASTRAPITVTNGRVEFRFAGLSFLVPSRVRYRYRLNGYEQDWTYTAEPKAIYTNLPARELEFRVEASNNDGLWNPVAASSKLVRLPRSWETLWFAALCFVLLGLASWVVEQYRLRSIRARQALLERTVDERTSDLRKEKERVEQAKTVIEAQASRLEELDRFKTRFFSNVSHEFRTPLTLIVGPLEQALKGTYGDLGDAMRRQSQIMLRNALRLLSLINQLMDLSKLESGSMPLKAGSKNLVAFLKNLQTTVTALAEKKAIDMPFEGPPSVEIYFEPDKLEKVFYNLLSNALKFTPAEGTVGIRVTETETDVTVIVHDTGAGIPKDSLAHIFDRFHQLEGSKSDDIEGTGIGLSLVREMVGLHGGTVSVTSEPGVGSEFSVTLRKGKAHLRAGQIVAASESAAGPSVAERLAVGEDLSDSDEPEDWTRVDMDAPLILVADDNPDVRSYIAGVLAQHGYRTVKAFDGEDALEKTRTRRPRLVLSDVMMPRMNGLEYCVALKADEAISHIPVILLTARATHESTIDALNCGADDYLPKPFNTREMLARIANLLRTRENQLQLADQTDELNKQVSQQLAILLEQRKTYESSILEERDRAVAASQLKQNILDNVSHEFRTPLTAIMGFAEILEEVSADGNKAFVQTIKQNGERLLDTLDALLRLANLKSQSDKQKRRRVEIVKLVSEVSADLSAELARPELEFVFDGGTEPVLVEADADALKRAFEAVIENAIKFTPDGRVEVKVILDPIGVTIAVTDSGIGIPAESRGEVFEPFKQLSDGLTRAYGGVGIGLSVAKILVEDHGGTITLTGRKHSSQKGTVAQIWLPIQEATLPPAPDLRRDRTATRGKRRKASQAKTRASD
ncbi:MAG: signal transduction histidine kinase/ligand-binding sensor domain-containing protein [Rhodothermales bacterium]|jgi:signal transduction histidine kinase/ligand-binding sensor domain-containing protein